MAWKTSSALEDKVRFVMEYERDEATMRELCARFGVVAGAASTAHSAGRKPTHRASAKKSNI